MAIFGDLCVFSECQIIWILSKLNIIKNFSARAWTKLHTLKGNMNMCVCVYIYTYIDIFLNFGVSMSNLPSIGLDNKKNLTIAKNQNTNKSIINIC